MTKPITIGQQSKILEFIERTTNQSVDGVWARLETLDSSTASDIIKAFYDRNDGVALAQCRHLKIIP